MEGDHDENRFQENRGETEGGIQANDSPPCGVRIRSPATGYSPDDRGEPVFCGFPVPDGYRNRGISDLCEC